MTLSEMVFLSFFLEQGAFVPKAEGIPKKKEKGTVFLGFSLASD